jgi:inner membrane protein
MSIALQSPPRTPGSERSAGFKFLIMMLAGFMLSIPILSIYLLNYDRQSRSQEARRSISEGWGGEQTISAPTLVIPYRTRVSETVEENGKTVIRTREGTRDLVIEAALSDIKTVIRPERRQRSIYEAVVYGATNTGTAHYALPDDLADRDIPIGALIPEKAQLRFALSDVRGLQGGGAKASLGGKDLRLLPGHEVGLDGFYAKVDASAIRAGGLNAGYSYIFRGNGTLSLKPQADETSWAVSAPWPSPSFKGDFLPTTRTVTAKDFTASWKIGGLSLGGQNGASRADAARDAASSDGAYRASESGSALTAQVTLFEPVDIYSQVDRATKYGFLFIGFTFVAFLMFDVIGGVRVSLVEYLLVGAGLVMFFVLLLAMAEVAGFGLAYGVASAAIIGLITSYSAAVLKSWGRARWIGAMLGGLYAVLYVLLSLEAYSLLIGALLLFVALAGVMYLTRNVDWGAKKLEETVLP